MASTTTKYNSRAMLVINQISKSQTVVAQGINPIVKMQFYRANKNVNSLLDRHFSGYFVKQ